VTDYWLPHHSTRGGEKISAIVLHYPAPNPAYPKPYSVDALHALLLAEKLSYHYYVTKDGLTHQFVQDDEKAWHAGKSTLHGVENVNRCSIGVCLENNGGEIYSPMMILTAATLCAKLCEQYRIPKNRIVGHCHVSPDRRVDPGSHFPWYEFFTYI